MQVLVWNISVDILRFLADDDELVAGVLTVDAVFGSLRMLPMSASGVSLQDGAQLRSVGSDSSAGLPADL
jgi:uncharacterized protein YpiB (UPF0302 family)